MRVLLIVLFLAGALLAEDLEKYPPLFGYVTGVAKDDTLNVRAKPNYRAKKVGELENDSFIRILKCKKISSKSTWCKIGRFKIVDYEKYPSSAPNGWVNAKYLDFSNRGYVLVNKKGGCDYAFGCKNGLCDVLTDINIETIKRSKLFAATRFSAGGGELCNPNTMFYDFKELHLSIKPKMLAAYINGWIEKKDFKNIAKYIHPTKGLLISYYTTFARENKHFSKSSYLNYLDSNKKIYWGESEGRGDKIYLNLKEFFKKFNYYKDFTLYKHPSNRYNFPDNNIVTYEIEHKRVNHNWKNLVVVLKKYNNRYYLVGLLFSRWTI